MPRGADGHGTDRPRVCPRHQQLMVDETRRSSRCCHRRGRRPVHEPRTQVAPTRPFMGLLTMHVARIIWCCRKPLPRGWIHASMVKVCGSRLVMVGDANIPVVHVAGIRQIDAQRQAVEPTIPCPSPPHLTLRSHIRTRSRLFFDPRQPPLSFHPNRIPNFIDLDTNICPVAEFGHNFAMIQVRIERIQGLDARCSGPTPTTRKALSQLSRLQSPPGCQGRHFRLTFIAREPKVSALAPAGEQVFAPILVLRRTDAAVALPVRMPGTPIRLNGTSRFVDLGESGCQAPPRDVSCSLRAPRGCHP